MNASFSEREPYLSRRDILIWGIKAAAGAVILQSCSSPEGDVAATPGVPSETVSPTTEQPTTTDVATTVPRTTLPEATSTTENPTTTTVPETTTTTEAPTWESEHYLPKESLVEGTKLADLSITNPDGQQKVNVPLYVVTHLNDPEANNRQLERGAIFEVAHPEINPEEIGENLGTPEMGLIGDNGTAIIFGHRVTRINPDWNGDPSDGNEGALQRVFEKLDELMPGARLNLALTPQAGGQNLQYELSETHIIKDFELPEGGTLASVAYFWRSGPSDKQYLRLLACHPEGQTRDRIAAEFVRIG